MTLGSGTIYASDINIECKEYVVDATVSLDDVDVRTLAGISSGQISFFNLRSKTFYGGKGYLCGGTTGSFTNAVQGLNFSTEAADNPSMTMADGASTRIGTTYPAIRGYTFTYTGTQIDGIIFSNDTSYNPSSTLPYQAYGGAMGSATKSYIHTAVISGGVNTFNFTNDTSSSISSILADGTRRSGAGISNTYLNKGYYCSGWTTGTKGLTTYLSAIDGIDFNTDTGVNPSATVAETIGEALDNAGTHRHSYAIGIWAGRQNGGVRNDIDGFNMSSLTSNNYAAVLSVARSGVSGLTGGQKSYFAGGGNLGTNVFSNVIDGFTWESGSCSAITATLPEASVGIAGKMSSGGNTLY